MCAASARIPFYPASILLYSSAASDSVYLLVCQRTRKLSSDAKDRHPCAVPAHRMPSQDGAAAGSSSH